MIEPPSEARHARVAVATLFFANGALFASCVPRYPEMKNSIGLSNAAFGAAIAGYALGALLVGLIAGFLVSRWGSSPVALVSFGAAAVNLALVGLAPTWAALAAALFVAGACDTVADVANNTHSLRVEALYKRSILNSLHGLWSIGAVVGAITSGAAAGLRLPLVLHFAIVGSVLLTMVGIAYRFLLPGGDTVERPPQHDAGDHSSSPDGQTVGRAVQRWRSRTVWTVLALGMLAATAQVMEDAGSTWSAIYLSGELGATAFVASLGFGALQASQTVGRLLADRLVDRFGDRDVARYGAALGGLTMFGALAVPMPLTTVIAFGLVGLGIGTLIPAGMRAANAAPGLSPGVGLAMAGTVLRVSGLVAAPVVGSVADAAGLRVGLAAIPVAALVAVILAGGLPGKVARR
ncbi:MFS transporter [Micromonospora sp. KC213]|uniref:MFS transporter n=1 Tax=Micromonospora sp. KC213 TaxID=2530378 RepID=UPI001A9F45B7|nr:MFS transporter [Micromonospora sp. KC213]